ncbi:hypothetical protein ABZY10_01695 [Streptomyces sp. NPDC006539]|uniref:hypothetical protein n=1 Tax=Streptomyces TaxID=1883 RepID=UPI003395B008
MPHPVRGHPPTGHTTRGELTLRIGNVTEPPTVQIARGVQLHVLDLLDTDIGQAHWPQT